jgi:hypothetical protein
MSQVETGQQLATTAKDLGTLLEDLSTPQQMALTALTEGKTLALAAEHAGVSRTTLWHWMKTQPKFVEAYEAWQQELRESARARLLKIADKAAEIIAQAIACGDARIALRILHDLGILSDRPTRKSRKQPAPEVEPEPQPQPLPASDPECAVSVG